MSGSLTIRGARLVLPDRVVTGDVQVVDGVIERVGPEVAHAVGETIDARGLTVMPGVIDTLADVPLHDDGTVLARVSGEAAIAGVTTMLVDDLARPVLDAMDLEERLALAARSCRVNVGVYASARGGPEAAQLEQAAGVRVHLGSPVQRTGVSDEALDAVFAQAVRPIAVDGQDPASLAPREALYHGSEDPAEHTKIYGVDLAAAALTRVVAAACRHGRAVHALGVTSESEAQALEAAPQGSTAFASLPHLFLRAEDAYRRLGVRAVIDPPVREGADVDALWRTLRADHALGVASCHVATAVRDGATPGRRGIPSIGAMLPLLLEQAHVRDIPLTRLSGWVSGVPAATFSLPRKGRLEVGFDADLVLVDLEQEASVPSGVAGWSPFAPFALRGRPVMTILRGQPIVRNGALVDGVRGRVVSYARQS